METIPFDSDGIVMRPPSSIQWLVDPIGIDNFREQYWRRYPALFERDDPRRFEDLLSAEHLEFVIQAGIDRSNAVEILEENERSLPCRTHRQALAALADGRSLRINGIQRFVLPVDDLSKDMEQFFGCPVNVNLYLTPGGGKALPRHYDTHDVFVLQIAGKKQWRLYDQPFVAPLEYLPLLRHESESDMKKHRLARDVSDRDRVQLQEQFEHLPGNSLYIPRGHWHEAWTEAGERSCHLTIGCQSVTYVDALTALIARLALKDHRLREDLPFAFATHAPADALIRETMRTLLTGLDDAESLDNALSDVKSSFLKNGGPGTPNDLYGASKTGPERVSFTTVLRLRRGLRRTYLSSADTVTLLYGDRRMTWPKKLTAACRTICASEEVSAAELPGDLSPEEKLNFIQNLMLNGLFVPMTGTEGTR